MIFGNAASLVNNRGAGALFSSPTSSNATSLPVHGSGAHASSLAAPSFTGVIASYIDAVLTLDGGMKVLLVDDHTLYTISTAISQTSLLHRNVFLVDKVTSHRQRGKMKSMRCVIFIRPQLASVEAACAELRLAKYSSYAVVFSGAVMPDLINRLAYADVEKLVVGVTEVFCDFSVVNRDVFLTEVYPSNALLSPFLANSQIRRLAEGLASVMVAQRCRPHIRYQRSSPFARRVATELVEMLHNDAELYNYRSSDTVLLLVDRSVDAVTPLLTPWTYQAMLHEHIGLYHNTLRLPRKEEDSHTLVSSSTEMEYAGLGTATARRDENEQHDAPQREDECGRDNYVFAEQDDLFYAANMFHNWGDVCGNVKSYVDKCKSALNLDRSHATLDELRQFLQNVPQTKSLAGSVLKHTSVTSYLAEVVKRRDLLHISLLEQDMVAASNVNDHWSRLHAIAARTDVAYASDLLRLCLIFYLRYERGAVPAHQSRTAPLLKRVDASLVGLLTKLWDYHNSGGTATEELFAESSGGVMASLVRNFVDVDNVYTQHEPVLKKTLRALYAGRLDMERFPYISAAPSLNSSSNSHSNVTSGVVGAGILSLYSGAAPHHTTPASLASSSCFKAGSAWVFMCGGYTLEEAALIRAVNNGTAFTLAEQSSFAPGGVTACLGGEAVLNSSTFLHLLGKNP